MEKHYLGRFYYIKLRSPKFDLTNVACCFSSCLVACNYHLHVPKTTHPCFTRHDLNNYHCIA